MAKNQAEFNAMLKSILRGRFRNDWIKLEDVTATELCSLMDALKAKPKIASNIYHLDIRSDVDDSITHFPDLRHLTGLQYLIIASNIATIPSVYLSKCNKLREIELFLCGLVCLPSSLFDECPELTRVMIYSESLTYMPKELFTNCSKLVTAEFYEAKASSIPNTLFHNCPNLENVSFKFGRLRSIPEDLFTNNPKLKDVDFYSNRINFVPNTLFHKCPALEGVNFQANSIGTIPANILDFCPNIKHLCLYNNDLQTLPINFKDSKIILLPDKWVAKYEAVPSKVMSNDAHDTANNHSALKSQTSSKKKSKKSSHKTGESSADAADKTIEGPVGYGSNPGNVKSAAVPTDDKILLAKLSESVAMLQQQAVESTKTTRELELRISHLQLELARTNKETIEAQLALIKAKNDQLEREILGQKSLSNGTMESESTAFSDSSSDEQETSVRISRRDQFMTAFKDSKNKVLGLPANTAALDQKVKEVMVEINGKVDFMLNNLVDQMLKVIATEVAKNKVDSEEAFKIMRLVQNAVELAGQSKDRALDAKQTAQEALDAIRRRSGSITASKDVLERINAHDQIFQTLTNRIGQMGTDYSNLRTQVAKLCQYETIHDALEDAEQYNALKFFESFVAKMQQLQAINNVIAAKRFELSYGTAGAVGSCLVMLAGEFAFSGLGTIASIAETGIKTVAETKVTSNSKQVIAQLRTQDEAKKVAIIIAASLLQNYGLNFVDKTDAFIDLSVETCIQLTLEYIVKSNPAAKLSLEELVKVVLDGYKQNMKKAELTVGNGWLNEILIEQTDGLEAICACATSKVLPPTVTAAKQVQLAHEALKKFNNLRKTVTNVGQSTASEFGAQASNITRRMSKKFG